MSGVRRLSQMGLSRGVSSVVSGDLVEPCLVVQAFEEEAPVQAMSLAASPHLIVIPLLVGERYAGDISALVTTGGRAAVRIERLTSLLDGLARPGAIERIRAAAGGVSHVDVDYLSWAGVDVYYDPERLEIRLEAHEALDERGSESFGEGFSTSPDAAGGDDEEKPAALCDRGLTADLTPAAGPTRRDALGAGEFPGAVAGRFGVLTAETASCIANGVHPGYAGSIGWNWTVMDEESKSTEDLCFEASP